MKKISLALLAVAAMMGFTACDNADKDNVLSMPEPGSYVLDEPAGLDQPWALKKGQTFELVSNIPDYGPAGPVIYSAEVALEETFENFETLTPKDNNTNEMQFAENDLNIALNKLLGMDYDNFVDPGELNVYMRTIATLNGNMETALYSNIVKWEAVQIYRPAAPMPTQIYLVGAPSGWMTPNENNAAAYADWALTETGVATDIFVGSFEVPAKTELSFRFYKELDSSYAYDGWGDDDNNASIGAAVKDGDNQTVAFDEEGIYTGEAYYPGKGNWNFGTTEAAGTISCTVDLNENTVTIKWLPEGEIDYSLYPHIFIVGGGVSSGWIADKTDESLFEGCMLYDLDGSGVYVSVAPVAVAEGGYFRFYTELGAWGDDGKLPSIGPLPNDNTNVQAELTDGTFTGEAVPGKGSWVMVTGGNYNMRVDLAKEGAWTVEFTLVEDEE